MYFERIFVPSSIWAYSSPWRTRASRRLLPISNMAGPFYGPFGSASEPEQELVEADRDRRGQGDADSGDAEYHSGAGAHRSAGALERRPDPPAGAAREQQRA